MIGIGVRALLFGSALGLAGCGGGGGGTDAGTGPSPSPDPILASFAADTASPGANTVSMLEGSKSGDTVTVRIAVTNTTGVYGAAFDVTYDATKVTYVNYSTGSLLEQGGHTPTYQVALSDPSAPGRVVAVVSRNGNVGTANASGTVDLVRLTFRVRAKGASRAEFGLSPVLYDGQPTPQPKPAINWTAGTFQGS